MDGLSVSLSELIALERYAQRIRYRPDGYTTRVGQHQSKFRGRGMDFSEARNYQAGDEIRHMEWRVTARTGRPHVKVYQEERERPVVILADFNPSMYFGTRIALKSVVAAKLSAIIAWTAAKQGDRVGGFLCAATSHQEFIPRARREGVLPFLATLSQYTQHDIPLTTQYSDRDALSHALLRMRRVVKPGSIVVLISDFYRLDADAEMNLSRLRHHNDVLAYHISDPLELAPPPPHCYAITNGDDDFILDTSLDTIRFGYQFYCDEQLSYLKALFSRLQIAYTSVTANMDLSTLVRQTFPRRT